MAISGSTASGAAGGGGGGGGDAALINIGLGTIDVAVEGSNKVKRPINGTNTTAFGDATNFWFNAATVLASLGSGYELAVPGTAGVKSLTAGTNVTLTYNTGLASTATEVMIACATKLSVLGTGTPLANNNSNQVYSLVGFNGLSFVLNGGNIEAYLSNNTAPSTLKNLSILLNSTATRTVTSIGPSTNSVVRQLSYDTTDFMNIVIRARISTGGLPTDIAYVHIFQLKDTNTLADGAVVGTSSSTFITTDTTGVSLGTIEITNISDTTSQEYTSLNINIASIKSKRIIFALQGTGTGSTVSVESAQAVFYQSNTLISQADQVTFDNTSTIFTAGTVQGALEEASDTFAIIDDGVVSTTSTYSSQKIANEINTLSASGLAGQLQVVQTATITNIDLSNPPNPLNGLSMTGDEFVGIFGQTDPIDNGFYYYDSALTEMVRPLGYTDGTVLDGQTILVNNTSSTFNGSVFSLVLSNGATTKTIGTDDLVYNRIPLSDALFKAFLLLLEKTSVVGADLLVINDSADSNTAKRLTAMNFTKSQRRAVVDLTIANDEVTAPAFDITSTGVPITIPLVAVAGDIDNYSMVNRALSSIVIPTNMTGLYEVSVIFTVTNNTTTPNTDIKFIQYSINSGTLTRLGATKFNAERIEFTTLTFFYEAKKVLSLNAGDVITFRVAPGSFTQVIKTMQLVIKSEDSFCL